VYGEKEEKKKGEKEKEKRRGERRKRSQQKRKRREKRTVQRREENDTLLSLFSDEPDAHVTLCSKSTKRDFTELFWEIFHKTRKYTLPPVETDGHLVFTFELVSPK
jgi:hypothetical protein